MVEYGMVWYHMIWYSSIAKHEITSTIAILHLGHLISGEHGACRLLQPRGLVEECNLEAVHSSLVLESG